MSRLVVVSNRVANPQKPAAGGLAVAVRESLRETGGIWFGWSGRQQEDAPEEKTGAKVTVQTVGNVQLVTADLSREEYENYYLGYANNVLWPVFHYRLDLARFDERFADAYRRVNRKFAHALHEQLKPDDVIWVHDYHLIPLAAELRALGCDNPIGFFLHIPLPPPQVLAAIPEHASLVQSLFAYDLVGFQTESDVTHFAHYLEAETHAERLSEGKFRGFGRIASVAAFPIGIDIEEFSKLVRSREGMDMFERMRKEYSRRQLLVGVDRLDYSKGLPQRLQAFRRLLETHEENRDRATLIQIAAPSREALDAYDDLRCEMDSLCGAINSDYGELDWMPVRYIHRSVARKRLPGLYRASRVALVTPLRDGMNLVAKEYLAAQDPTDPGVLVLSRFAGAAEQLKEAVLVNPYDTQEMAEAIQRALTMPIEERVERHASLMATIRRYDVHWWRKRFLDELKHAVEPLPA
ncbi:MAG TPA: alpha,alpha-trehalose-phosphate synthase (UDP-forming) [Trinickia sp.]|jgi:trehalose 6-phosphate synthase|uniref:alpha,alpha-trehalose-phosphate synthase (UDP-forming) n=1 Tax=Trinickia sp. TaxID=2571163 RepID=UPI002C504C34|nr:alpha,alpha-trehalose-phosphate synthase (UDP-forming) [Trinickia sp.]HTI18852.1 alpha,alpha-trehalose-phosphate synthase (UDP-forming) [Trinickia sp.]